MDYGKENRRCNLTTITTAIVNIINATVFIRIFPQAMAGEARESIKEPSL